MQGFRLWLTTVCSMQGIRMSPLSHDPFSFPSEERVGFPPWCRLAFMTIG